MWHTSNVTSLFAGTDGIYSTFRLVHALSQIQKLVLTVLVCCLGVYVYKKLHRHLNREKSARSLPGPWALPVVGNSLLFIFYRNADSITSLFSQYITRYGSKFRLWIGKHLLVVLTDAHDIRAVLMNPKNSEKPEILFSFNEFFGNGLPFGTVPVWSKSRKVAQPLFASLKQRNHILTKLISHYVDNLQERVDGPQFNLTESLKILFFQIITETFFDTEMTETECDALQFHQHIATGSEISMIRLFRPWLRLRFVSDIFYGKKWYRAYTKLHDFSRKIMLSKANQIEKFKNEEIISPESFPFQFLATFIQDEKDQGVDNLAISNVLLTMGAGTDTMTTTISFFVLAMAMFPEIQDKVYDEIYDLCGDDDREPDIGDIQKLQYLDQVLKEVQRRFTVLPLIFRKIDQDMKINDLMYPAGTALLISIANVHLDPTLYPNPFQFNPDNFSPEKVANRPKGSFIPFSAGPRNCIGMQFSIVVMKLFLVTFLRSFRIHSTFKVEDIDLIVGFVSHNRSGCPISISKRNKN